MAHREPGELLGQRSPARRLAVFSHPAHELAVWGLMQRLRPYALYLTDGGSGARGRDTRAGLKSIGLMERARFLDYSEESFYAALLARDAAFYSRVADAIRREIEAVQAEQVLCDAVEFYNPLHDMALPLVLAALAGRNDVAVFEIPIVYQRPEPGEAYEVQRFPDGLAQEQIVLQLTDQELAAKLRARDEIYGQTCRELGALVDIGGAHPAVEVVRPSNGAVPAPDEAARVLRYERRGRRLQQEGAIAQVITYADHYAPLTRLLGVG